MISQLLPGGVSLILSHHSRYKVTCECNEEGSNDDDDDVIPGGSRGGRGAC